MENLDSFTLDLELLLQKVKSEEFRSHYSDDPSIVEREITPLIFKHGSSFSQSPMLSFLSSSPSSSSSLNEKKKKTKFNKAF